MFGLLVSDVESDDMVDGNLRITTMVMGDPYMCGVQVHHGVHQSYCRYHLVNRTRRLLEILKVLRWTGSSVHCKIIKFPPPALQRPDSLYFNQESLISVKCLCGKTTISLPSRTRQLHRGLNAKPMATSKSSIVSISQTRIHRVSLPVTLPSPPLSNSLPSQVFKKSSVDRSTSLQQSLPPPILKFGLLVSKVVNTSPTGQHLTETCLWWIGVTRWAGEDAWKNVKDGELGVSLYTCCTRYTQCSNFDLYSYSI